MTYSEFFKRDVEPLSERIDAAIKRVTSGHGCMRIPAEPTDPDLVLSDCKAALATRDARIATLEAALREFVWAVEGASHPTCDDDECCGLCVIEAKDTARAALEAKS